MGPAGQVLGRGFWTSAPVLSGSDDRPRGCPVRCRTLPAIPGVHPSCQERPCPSGDNEKVSG